MVDRLLRLFPQYRDAVAGQKLSESWVKMQTGELDAAEQHVRVLKGAQKETAQSHERLCESLQKESARAAMLEDRLNSAYEDRQRLWSLVENSISKMETAYQMHVNVEWQKQGRSAPYPEAPQLPEQQQRRDIPNSIVPRPLTGSERMAAGTQQFINDYAARLAGQI